MDDPIKSLRYSLDKYPDRVEAIELRRLVMDSARQNPKRPAYVQLAVPDDMVKTLRGRSGEGDLLLLVRVPKEILERQDSRIILPGEV